MKLIACRRRVSLVLTVGAIFLGTAIPAAAASTDSSTIPDSALLAASELPITNGGGTWTGPSVRLVQLTFNMCTAKPARSREIAQVSYGRVPSTGYGGAYATVVTFDSAADAARARAKWADDLATCAARFPRTDEEGRLYVQGVDRVSQVDGVDVYGMRVGASFYIEAPVNLYGESFVVASGRTLYIVEVPDNVTSATHAPMPMAATVAAVKRRLAAVG
ncbi:hypothetical protein [Nonomuraea sp. NPDC049709]|uniref:hypothetical protein n=1 Tax=Nonomuraea sp. NPDC049709 TaxID=3154736 RepID=UPI0034433949